MNIIADQNIPFAPEAFGTLGNVTTLPGRGITREHLAQADALIVRSITKVNAALLEGSPVRFVGTCTIGEDHIDKPWLAAHNIGFASAPGCNANSVSEYITATLLELGAKAGNSLGIIGYGHVGKRVATKAQALGLRVVINDPPLASSLVPSPPSSGERDRVRGNSHEDSAVVAFAPLDEALACDFITLHVPLEKSGPHPTRHLINADTLARTKPGAVILNTARGPVIDSAALIAALDSGHIAAAVLDVWEGEPDVPKELINRAFLATPHIAGYSFDGKVNGTTQIYHAACQHFGIAPSWTPDALLPPPEVPSIDGAESLLEIIRKLYTIHTDDTHLREALALPKEERGKHFDNLRKNYRQRREFQHTTIHNAPAELVATLTGLGFQIG